MFYGHNYHDLVQKNYTQKNRANKQLFLYTINEQLRNKIRKAFPGGAVDKNAPSNAGDTGLNPDPGRFHMLKSN